MPSAMRAAAVLLAACLASAAEDPAPPSLRGGRSLANATQNATQAKQRSQDAAAGGYAHSDVAQNMSQLEEMSSDDTAADEPSPQELAAMMLNQSTLLEGNVSEEVAFGPLPLLQYGRGWSQGGDKMWGGGSGVESINRGNVRYYNAGMSAARSRCGGSNCALIVNPPGHRTINQFHIHFVHYAGYGANLKRRLERKVCGKGGWHGGGLPCGGRAAFFGGFPGVFSAAMGGGNIRHASVIAWPASCGGRGTIVELAFGCSIEHQIRGDFNPNYR